MIKMTICEICKASVHRRTGVDGLLVCWHCASLLEKSKPEIVKDAMKYYNEMREHWAELSKIRSRPSYGSVYAALPPKEVLQKAIIALEMSGSYQPFYDVLAEVYGIESPRSFFDASQVSENAVACYHPSRHAIYSKTIGMSRSTALHEFWHALEGKGRVIRDSTKEGREKNARDFSEACLRVLRS